MTCANNNYKRRLVQKLFIPILAKENCAIRTNELLNLTFRFWSLALWDFTLVASNRREVYLCQYQVVGRRHFELVFHAELPF